MTKTTPKRRAWLDSLKVGDLVCVTIHYRANQIASVTGRTSRTLMVDRARFSATTGRMLGRHGGGVEIAPATDAHRAELERQRAFRAVESRLYDGIPTSVLHLLELAIDWRNSPDVILAATERIHEVTKERMEAQR